MNDTVQAEIWNKSIVSGVLGTANSNAASLQLGSTFQIGADGNSSQQAFASFKNVKIYAKSLAAPQLRRLTA